MSDLSAGFSEPPRRKSASKFKWVTIIGIPLAAILFQVYVPRFFTYLAYLEMPLLVTVYFSLKRRSPPFGVLFGMCIGLAQDSLSNHPLGMFGIVKTLVGYFAASVSQRFEATSALLGWCWRSFSSSSTSSFIGFWRAPCWERRSPSIPFKPWCWRS